MEEEDDVPLGGLDQRRRSKPQTQPDEAKVEREAKVHNRLDTALVDAEHHTINNIDDHHQDDVCHNEDSADEDSAAIQLRVQQPQAPKWARRCGGELTHSKPPTDGEDDGDVICEHPGEGEGEEVVIAVHIDATDQLQNGCGEGQKGDGFGGEWCTMKVPKEVNTAECRRKHNDEGDNGEQDVPKRCGGWSWGRITTQKRERRHCGEETTSSNLSRGRGVGYAKNFVLRVVVWDDETTKKQTQQVVCRSCQLLLMQQNVRYMQYLVWFSGSRVILKAMLVWGSIVRM